jgi:predicted house-cleaning NTP pyrophosphatase (Maf/HAM1 superfamily)
VAAYTIDVVGLPLCETVDMLVNARVIVLEGLRIPA